MPSENKIMDQINHKKSTESTDFKNNNTWTKAKNKKQKNLKWLLQIYSAQILAEQHFPHS